MANSRGRGGKRRRAGPPSPRDPIDPARPRLPFEQTPYRRGEMVMRMPVTSKSLEQVGVRVLETGLIEWPRYETKGGEVGELMQLPQVTVLRGFSKAERREMHRFESVTAEHARLDGLSERIKAIHNYIVSKGFPTGEARTRLVGTLTTLKKEIEPGSRKKSKKDALGQFDDAIAFAEKGNSSACIQSMKGIVYNMRLRVSALNRQYPRLERSQSEAIVLRKKHQARVRQRIDIMEWAASSLARRKAISEDVYLRAGEFGGLAEEYARQQKEDPTPEGNALAKRYGELRQILSSRTGRWNDVHRRMVSIRQLLYVRYARNFIVNSDLFRESERWPPVVRQRMIDFQIGLVKDNLDVWRQYGNPKWIAPWLLSMANSMAQDNQFRKRQKHIARASILLDKNRPEQVIEELESALKSTN